MQIHKEAFHFINGNSNYETGVAIFSILSSNNNLKKLFLNPYSSYRMEKLQYELKKLIPYYKIKREIESESNQPEIESSEIETQETEINPVFEILKASIPQEKPKYQIDESFKQQRSELYRLRGHLHGRLHESKTNEERLDLCIQIMRSQEEIDELNRKISAFNRGEDFNAPTNDKLIENCKIYIARYKRDIKKATDPEKIKKLQNKIEYNQQRLNELKSNG